MTELEKANLERLVDVYGLETVLYALGDICAEKAEHIQSHTKGLWKDYEPT